MNKPTREAALSLLNNFIVKDSLRKHSLAVEAVMKYFALKSGEDQEKWGIVGLIHDLDYEKHPQDHCTVAASVLRKDGWPEEYVRAVLSHAWGICTDVQPISLMEKTLYTIDELTGFVVACALVRPSKSVEDLETASVLKKWHQRDFAASVDRGVVERGVEMLNVTLDSLVTDVILGLRSAGLDLGLSSQASHG